MKKIKLLIIGVYCIILPSELFSQSTYPIYMPNDISEGKNQITQAIDFIATDIHGNNHHLFDYLDNGKFVVLDFFFTTCPPCISSVPILNYSYVEYGCNNADVIFLGINYFNTDIEVVNYENNYGSLIPAISGVEGGGEAIVTNYGVHAFPTIIIIDPNRNIINQPSQYGIGFWPPSLLYSELINAGIPKGSCEISIFPPISTDLDNNINNGDKILIKIYNILGQETEEIPNTLLFYHYSDGTIEKKIIME